MGAQHGPSPSSMGPRRTFQPRPPRPAAAGFFLRQTRSQRALLLRRALLPTACPCFKTGVQNRFIRLRRTRYFVHLFFAAVHAGMMRRQGRVGGWPAQARRLAGAHRADAGWAACRKNVSAASVFGRGRAAALCRSGRRSGRSRRRSCRKSRRFCR